MKGWTQKRISDLFDVKAGGDLQEAKLWDYTMTEDLQQKIYAIKQSYIDSGKLTPEQIAALQ